MIDYLEKETESFISGILKEVFGETTDKIFHAIKNRLLEYQLMIFKNNYYTKSFFHRTQPVPLYDFYIPMRLQLYSYRYKNNDKSIKTDSCKELFQHSNRVTVIGTAGSGKSTLIKHLIVESIKNKFAIPILIELRELNRAEYLGDIHKFIMQEVFQYYKLGTKNNIIEHSLLHGGFLILFDGYDELNQSAKLKATTIIKQITQKYEKNCFLVTSRPYTNIELLDGFTNYELAGINEPEQNKLIKLLLKENEFAQKKILKEKSKKENKSYLTFLENPLLLSLFVITFEYHPSLPRKKSLFYEKVFQTLYEKHNSITKINFTADFYSELIEEDFRNIFELFSFISYFKNLFEFSFEEIRDILSEVKRRYPELSINTNSFTKDALENICIWFKDGDYYTFSHRSLQEYFAVRHISKLDPKTQLSIYDHLFSHFTKNYNLIELLAESPDINFYNNLLIPYIRKILEHNFKEIDGKTDIIDFLIENYLQFKHIFSFSTELSLIYSDFIEKYKDINFDNHPLILKHSISDNQQVLHEILLLNEHYSILENLIEKFTQEIVYKNDKVMDYIFRKKNWL